MENIIDLAIAGAGPAGMTAALYAARAGHRVRLFERLGAGGQAALTDHIENYPGFPQGVNGFDLTAAMQEQTQRFGAEFVYDGVEGFTQEEGLWALQTSMGTVHRAKALLIASGASARRTGAKGEEQFFGRGIGTCAVCDGAFYKDKVVAVIGGGDSALKESVYLSKIVKKIYLVHRRQGFRADKSVQQAFAALPNVEMVLDCVPEEFKGGAKLESLVVKNLLDASLREIAVDGVFLYVGLDPNTSFVPSAHKDKDGFIKASADGSMAGAPGLFAAGDCCFGAVRQVAAAVGRGAEVSYAIGHYLEKFPSH